LTLNLIPARSKPTAP